MKPSTTPDETEAPAFDRLMRSGSLERGVLMTIHRLSQGGADRVAMLLANGFMAAGIPTGIAVLRTHGEGERTMLELLDGKVGLSNAGPPMGSRHLELVRGLRFIQREVARTRPSFVMASSSNMGLVTGLSAKLRHGGIAPRFLMKLTNPVIRPRDVGRVKKTYRRCLYASIFSNYDRVLILSEEEREALTGMFPQHRHRLVTVTNPYVTPSMLIDTSQIRSSKSPNILALARMMPQKRLDRLLNAFALIAHKESVLTILGDGPERSQLEGLARSLGVAERVEMPGFVDDVTPWLRRANVFVLSSDYEGLPAAVFEALANNVPIVTTDCFPGARSLLADAEGSAVVAREDVEGFARAVDESLALTRRPTNLRNIAQAFTIDAGIESHVEALRALL